MCESCCTPILPLRAPGVPGTSRMARSPVLLKARGICLFSRSKRRGTEPGTPQGKLQHRGYHCGAPRQCCRRMAPAHQPGAYTVYTLITQTLLGWLPPSKIQLHLPRKPTALHVPGISLPSGFVVRSFFSRRIKIMFWHISGTSCGGAT